VCWKYSQNNATVSFTVLNITRINDSRDREITEKETHSTKEIGKGAAKQGINKEKAVNEQNTHRRWK
jgi:hypothetical protein